MRAASTKGHNNNHSSIAPSWICKALVYIVPERLIIWELVIVVPSS